MADADKKNVGPACACGKADLYEEWLKQNKKDAVSAGTNPLEKGISSSDKAIKQCPKHEQTGK